ncbi:MAG: lipopolysaccharide biosynthesis protein [Opitutales bacterium]
MLGVLPVILRRSSILGKFASLEMLNKAVMFLTGILVVRHLAKTDYAWYTITNSMIGGMGMLTALGVSIGLMSMGGERFGDRAAMGRLMTTCYRYRTIFAGIFGPIVIGAMAFMLSRNGSPAGLTLVLMVLVVIYMVIQINQDMAQTLLRLAGRYNHPQVVGVGVAIVRLATLGLLVVFALLEVWTALVVTVGLQAVGYLCFIRPQAQHYYSKQEPLDPEAGAKIRKITYNTLPETLKSFFMPQLGVFLIATFGNTENVADLGALGRLAMIFSIPAAFNGAIFQPWLARSSREKLLRNYLQLLATAAIISATVFATCWIGRFHLIDLLGDAYQGLEGELVLLAGSSSIALFMSTSGIILAAKGWVRHLWVQPLATTLVTIGCIPLVNFSDLSEVILLGYARFIVLAIILPILIFKGFLSHANSQHHQ